MNKNEENSNTILDYNEDVKDRPAHSAFDMSKIWNRVKLLCLEQESCVDTIPTCQTVLEYLKQVHNTMCHLELKASLPILKEIISILDEIDAIRIIYALITDKPLLREDEYKITDLDVLVSVSTAQLRKCHVALNFLVSRAFCMLQTILEDNEIRKSLMNSDSMCLNGQYSSQRILNRAAILASEYASFFTNECLICKKVYSKL